MSENEGGIYNVKDLKIYQLPFNYRKLEIFKFIKNTATLTVKLTIKKDNEDDIATGTIQSVDPSPTYSSCSCEACLQSGKAKKAFWKVYISTADHLFENIEHVKTTKAILFYDDSSSQVEYLCGLRFNERYPEQDACLIEFAAHDDELIKFLNEHIHKVQRMNEVLTERYKQDENLERLLIVVSHPYGGIKKVSLEAVVPRPKQHEQLKQIEGSRPEQKKIESTLSCFSDS